MKDENKTRSQLIHELQAMRQRAAVLEQKITTAERPQSTPDQTLWESEERLRLVLDATNDGIWDWDPKTGRSYFSPRYYTMLGYAPDEFSPTYENWRRLIHPDDVGTVEATVQRALEKHEPFAVEFRMKTNNGTWHWILGRGKVVALDSEGNAVRVVGSHTDITEHKRTAEALEKRIVALTRPLEDVESIAFEDLFNLTDIQHLQDLYAHAFGVAALITRPDGTPITQPSNFTVLCSQFVRGSEKGRKNCNLSDALIGKHNPAGPIIQPCLSAGLWNAGASITVGGRHIANWLIGQVRNESQKEEDMMAYARELGADESAFRAAYRQVPIMSQEQFASVAQLLFAVVKQLSISAYQNVQQARFITERKRIEESLRLTQFIFDEAPIGIWRMGPAGEVLDVNEQGCASLEYTREELRRMTVFDFAPGFETGDWEIGTRELNETGAKTTEAFHQRKSGEIIPIQVIEKLMRYEGQEYRLAFVQDISERKQSEESLRLSRFIIDNANVGIYRIDPEGLIKEVNQKAAQLLGYSREELESLTMADVDPMVVQKTWGSNWRKLVAVGMRNLETQHRRKDGSVIPVEVHSNLLEYEDQQYAIAFVQDITERKQNEAALREKDRLLHDIGKLVKFGAWKFDLETGKATSTDEVARIYDLEPDRDVSVERGFGCYHGVHRERIERAFNQATEHGIPYDLELEIISARGVRKWVRAIGQPVMQDGRVIQVQGSFQDITERKKAEVALRENEQLLGNVLESMNDAVGVFDEKLAFQLVNKKHEDLLKPLGKTRQEIIGKPLLDVFPHLKNTVTETMIRKAMKGEIINGIESIHTYGEKSFWVKESYCPLKDANGRVIGVVGVANDITQQKQDEEELHRLRNYLSNIIDSMPSIIVAVDSEGQVTQWNHQTEQTTGLSFEEARRQPLTKVFPRLTGEMERIKTSIQEQRVISTPKVCRKVEQEIRYEDITIFPLVTHGVEGAVIRVDDVTQQVRLEEMMIQSEKMLSMGGLAAGMAHEINNPLAGILQSAWILENRLLSDLPANRNAAEAAGITLDGLRGYLASRKLDSMIENIRESGTRAADIVRNMLSFARKSDRIISLQNLGDLLDQTIELVCTDYDMKKCYDFKRIKINREYDPRVPPIPCESSKLQQVFMNILKNGAEAMAEVRDSAEQPAFVLRVKEDGEWVRVEIEDNGPGMDKNTRWHIFEPFFTTKPVGRGTGLGLSVSYFIVTGNHGGEMHVQAVDGGGTCFVIQLPKAGKA